MSFTPRRLLPDVEDVLRDILLASGIQVGANVPADLLKILPFISARRFGGSSVHPKYLDRATVAVDVWSGDRRNCAAIAETCRTLLFEAWQSQSLHANATLARFVEVSAPSELRTDGQADKLVRFTAAYSLFIRPQR